MTVPADTQTQCPHCGFTYAVTPEQAAAMAGRAFACTNCGQPFTLSPSGGAFAQPPPAQHVAYASGAHVKSNPLAIASLICGCLLCVPFVPGIASIVTGAMGMRKARDPAVTGKGMAIAGLVLGILNLLAWGAYFGLIFAIMVPSMGVARRAANQAANQATCSNNLRLIGVALASYAASNNGAYPDTIEQLVGGGPGNVASSTLDCPVTMNVPRTTTGPQPPTAQVDYVYLGKGLTSHSPRNAVLAYEPVPNHGNGSQMLFVDGSVQFTFEPQASQMIAQIESGQNPPTAGAGARFKPRPRATTARSRPRSGATPPAPVPAPVEVE